MGKLADADVRAFLRVVGYVQEVAALSDGPEKEEAVGALRDAGVICGCESLIGALRPGAEGEPGEPAVAEETVEEMQRKAAEMGDGQVKESIQSVQAVMKLEEFKANQFEQAVCTEVIQLLGEESVPVAKGAARAERAMVEMLHRWLDRGQY